LRKLEVKIRDISLKFSSTLPLGFNESPNEEARSLRLLVGDYSLWFKPLLCIALARCTNSEYVLPLFSITLGVALLKI
jgi:hypothetical protein